tara:strand:- start:8121 stop:8513 length:393 start_codon:yes stop_codon:yes gene_type:complete
MKKITSHKKLKEFGLLIGLGFPLLIGWIIPSLMGHNFRLWTIWISLPALFLAFTFPGKLRIPYQLWMKLGHILGLINSRLILILIFFFVLQPISIVMRLFGYDPLRIKKNNAKSYREKRVNNSIDLTRIF